ncbi:hypothetical protein Patl1_20654 [Pistacia atlantica]|uniref:Uncharacterized protein n=1 Tax=Pistacia atlantica TaxID=434234 RepID=A0ACC1BIL0_9ROSI|nr:hypothetical protein Patl1_20654 [Pistacia atlantica]
MSPFEITYGRKPPSLFNYCAGESVIVAIDQDLRSRDEIISHLHNNLLKAQTAMKIQADKHRKEVTFEVGNKVLLKLQPYRQISMGHRSSNKLSLRYYGPLEVVEPIGSVAYRLRLPAQSHIHPVVHCSLLKPFYEVSATTIHPLPEDSDANKPYASWEPWDDALIDGLEDKAVSHGEGNVTKIQHEANSSQQPVDVSDGVMTRPKRNLRMPTRLLD